jgi:hypothetical protein
MVEQVFHEPFTDERYAALAKKIDPCIEVRRGLWRRTSISSDKLRMICEFEAPDAESVREAFRSADIAFERVWTANVQAIEDYPEMMTRLAKLLERTA